MSRAPPLQTVLAAELARIAAEIARLEAERDTLLRLERRLNGASDGAAVPTQRLNRKERGAERTTLRDTVQEVVTAGGADGLKVADVTKRVRELTPWEPGSIRTALYNLAAQGLLKREGHVWKPAETV